MNKRIFYIFALMLAVSTAATAQEDGATQLGEVTVNGTRTVNKADGMVVYPTEEQKQSASSGYSLLNRISLPEIRIDEVAHTITATNNRGAVLVRINGITVSAAELLSLDCNAVERIEYIDRPGLRYGEGTGYVVNIIVRRSDGGYTLGANLTNGITSANGNNSVFARANKGKEQWEAAYGFGYQNEQAQRTIMTARYTMPDNSVCTMRQEESEAGTKNLWHNGMITYNRADSGRYVIQVKAGGSAAISPESGQNRLITMPDGAYTAERRSGNKAWSPVADVYMEARTGRHQTITANAVVTGFVTDYSYSDTDGGLYRYDIKGRSWSLTGEAIYENRLKPFTLSAGIRYNRKHIDNEYTGDVSTRSRSTAQTAYLFGQIVGTLAGTNYTAGLGISHADFSNTAYRNDFVLMRPKLSLSRPLSRKLKLLYDFSMSQHVSAIANTNNVTLRRNTLEKETGNPSLRPNRMTEHTLRLSYSGKRLQAYAEAYARLNDNPNMMKYIRETDDEGRTTFIYKQTNQPGCDMFTGQLYANWDIIPEHLSMMVYGGPFRFINTGDDYRHCHSSFNGGTSLTAYIGPLTLTAYADNGWNWMEGEAKGKQAGHTTLSAQYRKGNMTVALYWQQPLRKDFRNFHNEITSRYVSKDISTFCRDDANRLSLNLTWKLNRGRRYQDINRTMRHSDKDAGVMK